MCAKYIYEQKTLEWRKWKWVRMRVWLPPASGKLLQPTSIVFIWYPRLSCWQFSLIQDSINIIEWSLVNCWFWFLDLEIQPINLQKGGVYTFPQHLFEWRDQYVSWKTDSILVTLSNELFADNSEGMGRVYNYINFVKRKLFYSQVKLHHLIMYRSNVIWT